MSIYSSHLAALGVLVFAARVKAMAWPFRSRWSGTLAFREPSAFAG